MNNSTSTQPNDQYSLAKSFLLHIAPGILVTVVFILLKPFLDTNGYPSLLAFLLAILLIDIPFMLGVMLNEGKKLNGRYSLEGVVLYRKKISWKNFAVVFIGAFLGVYILMMLVTPISNFLTENILVLIFTFQLVLTGIILPWVEELYFRGYLMPRISRFEKWAPLLGGFFFGLYHIWQLYSFPTVFLLGAALGYIVWWNKDIRLNISLHVFANLLGRVMFLIAAVTM